jgi:tetratricopeptide (TPR) repeat protein
MDHFAISWRRDDACSIDALQFQTAVTAADRARKAEDSLAEIDALKMAGDLYADDLLLSAYDPWLVPIREKLHNHMSNSLHRLSLLLEQQGEVEAAIAFAQRLVTHDPLKELNYQLLFRLQAAGGDRASALRTYHQLKAVLRRELGVQPGPETIKLFESVLKNEHAGAFSNARPTSERKDARPLVARRLEKQCLAASWARAVRGNCQAIIVSGEPGIGKTRLAEELLYDVAQQRYTVVRARCYSGRGQVPYAPIAEWLRSDSLRAVWSKLLDGQIAEIARLIPEIHEVHPILEQPHESAESWQKAKLYEALSAALANVSHPILLFIDDLQWCDSDSFEWLSQMLTSSVARGILLLGTVRAEETGRDHPFTYFMTALRQAGIASEVALPPLDAIETAELASRESNETLSDNRLEAILRSTKGNPLFVLESVRSGLESTRVHAVISARLANLSASSYELAGLASVVGRPFSFELLEKASDWDDKCLTDALDELWQRRIIEGRGHAEYDFTHDRLREVTRSELSPVRLRYLHRRVARALADTYRLDSQEWSGQIASHYEQAGMDEQAVDHLFSAAKSSRQRFAYKEAAALLGRALALCQRPDGSPKESQRELDLLLLLGTVLVTTEGYCAPIVGDTYRRALELARVVGGNKLFSSLSGLWVFHVVRGEIQISLDYALEFLQSAGDPDAFDLQVAGNFLLGSSLLHLGRLGDSLHHLALALEPHVSLSNSVLEVFGGSDVRVFNRAYLSHAAWHRASHEADTSNERFIIEAVQTADQMRNPFIQAIALNYAAMLYALKADSLSALQVGRRAMSVCNDSAFSYYLAMATVLTGWALTMEGEVSTGIEQLKHGLDSMRALGAELRLPYFYALLAQAYGRAGLWREATASLSTGFAFAGKNGETWTLAELHRVHGDLLVVQGKSDEAITSYKRALEAAQRCGSLAFERRLAAVIENTAPQQP